MTNKNTFKFKYIFKSFLLPCVKEMTLLLLGVLAVAPTIAQENPKNSTENTLASIITLTKELAQKCPKHNFDKDRSDQCFNNVLKQRGCKTYQLDIQDPDYDGHPEKYGFVTIDGKAQCLPDVIESGAFERDDFPGPYFLRFGLKEKLTSEDIKNLKLRKRFNSLNEYEGDGVILELSEDPNGRPMLIIGSSKVWKSGEFTFARFFTFEKSDPWDLRRADIYSLPDGEGKITNLVFDSNRKLAQIEIVGASSRVRNALSEKFTEKFGMPKVIHEFREDFPATFNSELNKEAESEEYKKFKKLLRKDFLSYTSDKKLIDFYTNCKSKQYGIERWVNVWANDLVGIKKTSSDLYCVGTPSLRLDYLKDHIITISSQSFLHEKEIERLEKEREAEGKYQKEQKEISNLF